MSTISFKNPYNLSDNFAKDYTKYENYIKHCINILKSLNWLKENQFNQIITDYEYNQKLMHYVGLNQNSLVLLNQLYFETIKNELINHEVITINTNKYYVNKAKELLDSITNLIENDPNFDIEDIKVDIAKFEFSRKCVKGRNLSNKIDLSKEYNEEEILEMIEDGLFFPLYSDMEYISANDSQILIKVLKKKIEFNNEDFKGSYALYSDVGDAVNYFSLTNEDERKKWCLLNKGFIDFIRYEMLNFSSDNPDRSCIQCKLSFDITFEHIEQIMQLTIKNFKRRKKDIPNKYLSLNNNIKNMIISQKEKFYKEDKVVTIKNRIVH